MRASRDAVSSVGVSTFGEFSVISSSANVVEVGVTGPVDGVKVCSLINFLVSLSLVHG